MKLKAKHKMALLTCKKASERVKQESIKKDGLIFDWSDFTDKDWILLTSITSLAPEKTVSYSTKMMESNSWVSSILEADFST